jgi:hypothetical protein
MIRIPITQEASDAIAATLPLGSMGLRTRPTRTAGLAPAHLVNRLRAGESLNRPKDWR